MNRYMQVIEGSEFSVKVNLCSGINTAIETAQRDLAVMGLMHRISKCDQTRKLVCERVVELSFKPFDHRYACPFDAAIFGYLVVLKKVDEIRFWEIVERLEMMLGHLWWARHFVTISDLEGAEA